MRAWSLLLVTSLLAGCGEPSSTQDPAPTVDAGSLGGIIVDRAIVPIPDVTLRLESANITTATDANGVWRMDNVAPGSYFLHATKEGFVSIQTGVTVTAGEITDVALELVQNQTEEAFVVPTSWRGFIDCSVRIGTGGASGSVGLNACNELGTQGLGQQDVQHVHEFPEGQPDFFQTEVRWDKTQTGGNDLAVMVGPADCTDPKYSWTSGGSPQWYNMDQYELRARDVGPESALCTRVFAATSEDLAYVAGFQFQQGFESFSHAFYNTEPPAGWLFVVDGAP